MSTTKSIGYYQPVAPTAVDKCNLETGRMVYFPIDVELSTESYSNVPKGGGRGYDQLLQHIMLLGFTVLPSGDLWHTLTKNA
jgi:hypothetical protein